MTIKPAFQKIIKGILHLEDRDKNSYENMGINKSPQMSR
jgi:hypothetical protein